MKIDRRILIRYNKIANSVYINIYITLGFIDYFKYIFIYNNFKTIDTFELYNACIHAFNNNLYICDIINNQLIFIFDENNKIYFKFSNHLYDIFKNKNKYKYD